MCRARSKSFRSDWPAPTMAQAPLDKRAIVALALCNAAHFYSLCSIFSYAAFLTVDCGWAPNIDKAGFVAGLLPTVTLLGRTITSAPWGFASDRWGRRRCMVASMLAVAAGNISFGLATNLPLVLAIRFVILGGGNGYVSMIGPLTLDIGGSARQAEVMGLVFSAGGVVSTAGPAIAGVLYGEPAVLPALVPSIIGMVLALAAALLGHAWLPAARQPLSKSDLAAASHAQSDSELQPVPPTSEVVVESVGASPVGAAGAAAAAATDPTAASGASDAAKPKTVTPLQAATTRPLPRVILLRIGAGFLMFGMFDVVPLWVAASRLARVCS